MCHEPVDGFHRDILYGAARQNILQRQSAAYHELEHTGMQNLGIASISGG